MSRHRNVRKLDYNEEYGYEDVYGKSLEDEVAISPSTAAQFIFHREQRETPSLKSYFDSREHGSPDAGRKPQISSATSPLATVSTGVAPGGWREGGRDSMDGGTGVSSDGWHGRGKGEESIDGNSRVSSGSWQRREERGSADVSTREHVPSVPPGFKPLHKEEGGAYGEGGGGVRMKTEDVGTQEETRQQIRQGSGLISLGALVAMHTQGGTQSHAHDTFQSDVSPFGTETQSMTSHSMEKSHESLSLADLVAKSNSPQKSTHPPPHTGLHSQPQEPQVVSRGIEVSLLLNQEKAVPPQSAKPAQQPSLMDLVSQRTSQESRLHSSSTSEGPSLSDFARHQTLVEKANPQPAVVTVRELQGVATKPPSFSSIGAHATSSASGTGSVMASHGRPATRHPHAREEEYSQPSLADLIAQGTSGPHRATNLSDRFLDSDLSHRENEEVALSKITGVGQDTAQQSLSALVAQSGPSKPAMGLSSRQPSHQPTAAVHSSFAFHNPFSAAGEPRPSPSSSKGPSLSDLVKMHDRATSPVKKTSKQSTTEETTSFGIHREGATGVSSPSAVSPPPSNSGHSLSQLTQMHLQPATKQPTAIPSLRQQMAKIGRTEDVPSRLRKGEPWPSTNDRYGTWFAQKYKDEERVTFARPTQGQRYFALVMCRSHDSQTSRQVSCLHRKVLRSLSGEFYSNVQFDFATPSPDDLVRMKQKRGFGSKTADS